MSNPIIGSLCCAFTGAAGGAVAYGLVHGLGAAPAEPLVSMAVMSLAVIRSAMFADEADMSIMASVAITGASFIGGNMACGRIFGDKAEAPQSAVHTVTDGRTVEQRMLASAPKALSLVNKF